MGSMGVKARSIFVVLVVPLTIVIAMATGAIVTAAGVVHLNGWSRVDQLGHKTPPL